MRRIIVLMVALLVFLVIPGAPVHADNVAITVLFDGTPMNFEVPPTEINGYTMVPMRIIFEKLGFQITWNAVEESITGLKNGKTVTLYVGRTYARIVEPNGSVRDNDHMLQVPPTIINGVTMVPLRFVGEQAGATVEWNGHLGTINIGSSNSLANSTPSDTTNKAPEVNEANDTPSLVQPVRNKVAVIDPPAIISTRLASIRVQFDPSIPEDTQAYVRKLVMDIDPSLRKFLGAPLQEGSLTLTYIPGSHVSLSQDKTVMAVGKLPVTTGDKQWDEIFLVNYIHKFLQGGNIPFPGIRYTENLAHSIKELVAEYMEQQGIRDIAFRGINYYLEAYPAFKTLKPETILNNGNTNGVNTVFTTGNFLFENTTYDRLNAFTIEYAKSVWLRLAYARYLESGSLDFFAQLKEQLIEQKPQTKEKFKTLIEGLVPSVEGEQASEWMDEQALFSGQIRQSVTVSAFVVHGNFFNVSGRNNPDYVYPLAMARSPARLLDLETNVVVRDESGNQVLNTTIESGYNGKEITGVKLPINNMAPGKYTVVVNSFYEGREIEDQQEFYVYETAPIDDYWINVKDGFETRNASIKVIYDSTITSEVQEYVGKLINDIDPIIRKIAGAPHGDKALLLKHDENGLAGMNADIDDMRVLNLARLPRIDENKVDVSFDSFFYIEYYHMFHDGSSIPLEYVRYSENISQAMKIVVAHYLRQYHLRETGVNPIPYYLGLNRLMDGLGPGILVNLGRTNGNPGWERTDIRAQWDDKSRFQMGMNVFTLEYGPTAWLVLADAYYSRTGEYGFFRELQNELHKNGPRTPEEYYQLIDKIVDATIDGKRPSAWLKGTALYQPLPQANYFVKPLPIRGSIRSMQGSDDPDAVIPLVVSRKGAATVVEKEYELSVVDETGAIVFQQNYTPVPEESMGIPRPIKLPKLAAGDYRAVLSVEIDGTGVTGEQTFRVH